MCDIAKALRTTLTFSSKFGGWRSADDNEEAGGDPESLHMEGNAADFYGSGPYDHNSQGLGMAIASVLLFGDNIWGKYFGFQIFWHNSYGHTGYVHLGVMASGPSKLRGFLTPGYDVQWPFWLPVESLAWIP